MAASPSRPCNAHRNLTQRIPPLKLFGFLKQSSSQKLTRNDYQHCCVLGGSMFPSLGLHRPSLNEPAFWAPNPPATTLPCLALVQLLFLPHARVCLVLGEESCSQSYAAKLGCLGVGFCCLNLGTRSIPGCTDTRPLSQDSVPKISELIDSFPF